MYRMKHLFFLALIFLCLSISAQKEYKTFELRYFTNAPNANGETDFKGDTEWMDTNQRIQFLNEYANYASRFFEDPELNRKVVSENEIDKLLDGIKPQPLTSIRQTIPLKKWKAYGYKAGQDMEQNKDLESWKNFKAIKIENGSLQLENGSIKKKIDSLTWRFKLKTNIKLDPGSSCTISLSDGTKKAIETKLSGNSLEVISNGKKNNKQIENNEWIDLVVEGDFTQKRFNLSINEKQLHYYIPMADTITAFVDNLRIETSEKVVVDNISIFNFKPLDNIKVQYASSVVLDENFEPKPKIAGWQRMNFDDAAWKDVDLPSAHGGIREKEEDYYLRKEVKIGSFERAVLELETLDPGGEVWINGEVVAVVNSRHPVSLDVTKYLKQNATNLIGVRVKPWKSTDPMHHAPSDLYIGWFLGRTKLILSGKCMIKNALVHTESLDSPANQSHKIFIQNKGKYYFKGAIEINYYPWFPEEGGKIASYTQNIQVRPGLANDFEINVPVYSPKLWTYNNPYLYKVEFILKDEKGNAVDDYVTTAGIRKVGQEKGDFYFNGKPDMLNGAQIMGFRMPIEDISKNNRCASNETIAEELLMVKKLGGNMLRIHVHAQNDTTDGINDARYAEMADQLGMCLIWQTAGWVRNGEAWNVDFKGFPEYIKQVYNHPSIVMWEAGNHPNLFKLHDIEDTHDFIKACYHAIYSTDQSRIISPTSFWQHAHYANYDGTMDYKGNKIKPVPEYMAKLVTRGSQDAYTGYGHAWTSLRKAPNDWAASCLASGDKAYFNFEHEESIGQPNWELCKGKPWYLLHSYEHKYDAGSIGKELSTDEWRASQAWQAFAAWESMKKQILLGYDGFSWCCLHGGANMGTYKKPLIDCLGHSKLAFYTNRMAFQPTWAGSGNVDVVYGPEDKIKPVINHIGEREKAELIIRLETLGGKIIEQKRFDNLILNEGHTFTELDDFQFSKKVQEGTYVISYEVVEGNK